MAAGVYLWFDIVDETIFRLVGLISSGFVSLVRLNVKMGVIVFAVLAVALIGVAIFESLIFSRKIAGPLFAFLRHLKKIEESGRFEKFALRKDDLFVEMATGFNAAVDAVHSKPERKSAKVVPLSLGVRRAKQKKVAGKA
jgi:hypothetical protein